jgi:hypothetical protein
MVLGNPDPLLEARAYPDKTSLKNIITEFIRAL